MGIPPKMHLTLSEWIEDVGVIHVANMLRVEKATVRLWRRGKNLPRTEQMKKIRTLSKGRVTYDQMIDSFHG